MLIMKSEMAKNGANEQFLVIGQFFSHVTDWEEAQGNGGVITEAQHEARCRNRLRSLTAYSLKEKRRAKRKFKAYLRT